jgi:hypothetical protein
MDVHSFTAGADFRAHAATMTGSSGRSVGTLGDVVALDGTTVPEADGENGAIRGSSDIAGRVLATAGTYDSKAPQFNTGSLPAVIRPYDFCLRVLSESPIPDMEPAHGFLPPAPRSSGWRGRVIGPATAKNDIFVITVNGDHMIGVIVVVDLERGVPGWKVIAGGGVFTGSFIITL